MAPGLSYMDRSDYDVRNPFVGAEGYQCFGCDPNNGVGLRLTFHRRDDVVTTTWHPRGDLEGYPGVVHGGIQATLADEVGSWYIYAVIGTAGVTKDLRITYENTARVDEGPFRIVAKSTERSAKQAVVDVELFNDAGVRVALASVTYALFSEAVARKRLLFPGADAFLPDAP